MRQFQSPDEIASLERIPGKIFFQCLIVLLVLPCCSKSDPDDPFVGSLDERLPSVIEENARTIERILGEDWEVVMDERSITLQSKFDVFHVGTMSRPDSGPTIDATLERLQNEGPPQKYEIILRFEAPLDKDELIRRRAERQRCADLYHFGTHTKVSWGDSAKALLESARKVPRYRLTCCDVFREIPETPGRQFFPIDAVARIGAAKEVLDVVFCRKSTEVEW